MRIPSRRRSLTRRFPAGSMPSFGKPSPKIPRIDSRLVRKCGRPSWSNRFAHRSPRPRNWPRLILYPALLLIAAASWALYIRSQTGVFPPFVAKLESKIRALSSGTGKPGEYSTQAPRPATDEHGVATARPQNPETADAPAAESQTSAIPAASSPAAVPTLQPVVAQSSSDHPISESASVSGTPAPTPPVESPQKPDPFHRPSPQALESSDHNQPAADNATAHDSLAASSASRDNERDTENDK